MQFEHMREFLVLTDTLNYRIAAQKLYISQPSLTKHIAAMEEELGVALIDRSSHAVKLSECGTLAAKHMRELIGNYESMLVDLDACMGGFRSLRLGILSYGISLWYAHPLMSLFKKRHPDTELKTISDYPILLIQGLCNNAIDACITLIPKYCDRVDRLTYHPLGIESLQVIMSKEHPLAARGQISLGDVVDEPVILLSSEAGFSESLKMFGAAHGLRFEHTVYTENLDTMLVALKEENAVFIGSQSLRFLPGYRLAYRELVEADAYHEVCLVYRTANENPAIPALVACAKALQKQ